MKQSVRESVNFLSNQFNLDRAKVYAYLSAGVDYEVSQVVDKTKGIHALIPKVDFRDILTLKLNAGSKSIDVGISSNQSMYTERNNGSVGIYSRMGRSDK